MSFAKHNLGVNTLDAPEFLEPFPRGTPVTVPFPINNHPTWTTYPYAGVDIPDTFDNLIINHLPNARLEPVLYTAAIDTIRMTNRYFELVGQYRSTGRPLTEKLVRRKEREWRNEKTKDITGRDTALYPPDTYPRPPDLRTLFVKDSMGDPTNDKLKPLWARACRDFHSMTPPTIDRYLRSTRDQLIAEAKARFQKDDSWLILEIFKRYLVWRNFVMEQEEDQQPTRAQMEAFFARADVVANGATLVEICHAFPYARDMRMLVYRIQRFATLEPQSSTKTEADADDPVESRYIRNQVPSEKEITDIVTRHLAAKGSSVSLPELLTRYWPNSGNHQIIADTLVTIARPDVTTRRFILVSHDDPDADEISSVLPDEDLDGLTLRDIAELLPNRVLSLDQLAGILNGSDYAYFDENEQRYFLLYESDSRDHDVMVQESTLHRNKLRLAKTWNAQTIHEYEWDVPTQRYVRRAERSQFDNVNATFYAPQSPTEVDILFGRTPSPEPQQPRITLQSGVVVAVQTIPITPAVAPPVAPSAAPPVEATAASEDTTTAPGAPAQDPEPPVQAGRGKKRRAEDPPEPSKEPKKVHKTPKIRCSQNTQKGTRCKKLKDRVDGEEDWDCGIHKR